MKKKWLAILLSGALLISCLAAGVPMASAEASFDFEIIQDFSEQNSFTRNSMWSRGLLATVKNPNAPDGATDIYQLAAADQAAGKDKLNGTPAMAVRMASAGHGWGASHLINDPLPEVTIENMSGVFFRMKTDSPHATALSVTTVGAGTQATGAANNGTNPAGKLLTDADKNDNNACGNAGALVDNYSLTKNSTNVRFYSVAGVLVGSGNVVPAGFDGYVFIEVANWESYTKDGLTINWTDSDYKYVQQYASSIAGSANKWCLNDGTMISVIIDDVGYYAVGSAVDANYTGIIDSIENPVVSDYNDFEIIQDFSEQNSFTRNSMWSRGLLATVKNPNAPDGATDIYQLAAADQAAGKDKLNGTPAMAVRMASAGHGWGASHLINDPLPEASIEDMSGVFFRMKTDSPHATALSVTTVGAGTQATGAANNGTNPAGKLLTDADKNDNNACGNAGALLDEYSLTKKSKNVRYYSVNGELLGTGNVVPAGFDGYVFIEVKNWNSFTKDGLTINWIDSDYKYVQQYAAEIAGAANKWCLNDGTMISVIIDDVGYYAVGSAVDSNYAAIIDKIENPVVSDYNDFEIIQDFSEQSTYTRNSMWSRGLLATVKNPNAPDGATDIYQLAAADQTAGKDMLNGTSAMAVRMASAGHGWGASHLINDPLPEASIEDMSGVFFRMKTDSPHATALSVTTVGAGTQATGAENTAANPSGKLLTDADKNDNNACGNAGALLDEYSLTKKSKNVRYYSVDGELLGTGNVVPAGFDGYVFIEVKNWKSFTKDGLTINWIDSDYKYVQQYASSIAGSANKWCLNDGTMISVVIDDVGYYAVGSAVDANYVAIIDQIENPVVSDYNDFEIIQDFSEQNSFTRNSMWSRGLLATVKNPDAPDGATHIYQLSTEDVAAGKDKLNGTSAMAVRMASSGRGWGASHLVNNPLPAATIMDMSGVFFRMKTDSPHATALSVTTVGVGTQATGAENTAANPSGKLLTDADKNDNNACGNAGALLDEYSLTKNSKNIRYYSVDGELIGSGRAVPAGFDGYVFVEVEDWESYTKDGLTINWIDSDYKYVQQYAAEIAGSANKWCLNDGRMISVVIDDVGYYAVGSAVDTNYAAIIDKIKNAASGDDDDVGDGGNTGDGSDEEGEFKYEMLSTFETEAEQDVGLHYCGETYITQANALSGYNSLAGTVTANDWPMYTLVRKAPEPGFDNVTGFFFRMKVDNDGSVAGNGDRQICTSTGTAVLGDKQWAGAYACTWGPGHSELVFVWLNGDVERGFLVPDNFDGYVFVNSQTAMDTMYDNGCLKSLRVVLPAWSAWQNNPLKWQGSFINFDNVGYFSVFDRSSNRVYQDLAAKLAEEFPESAFPEDYIPQMQTYMTYEDETVASTEGSSMYYFKPYLYYHTELPVAVQWSVTKGEATVEPLDDPDDAGLKTHGAKIIFGSAGEVTIRAALRDDPTQYADYTFMVKKDASKLDSTIFDAVIASAYAEGEWLAAFEQAIDAAREVLMDENVTQGSYNAYIDFLNMLISAYENGEPVPYTAADDAVTDDGAINTPPTGDHGVWLWAALILLVSLASLCVCTLKKKVRAQ